jgi:RNA polymerase sigma-70 factor (ECF subfamily)
LSDGTPAPSIDAEGADVTRSLESLTAAAAAGDRGAVDELLGRYLPELRAFVRLRVGTALRAHESCSDIVQSVCREILEHQERFRHPSEAAFKRWLFTTALRKVSDRWEHWTAEKRDARRELPAESAGDDGALAVCYSNFMTPSGAAMLREEIERVEAAFAELSAEQREVITLAHLVGLSRAEIAAETGRSEGAVRVLLHRSLARLAELLDESTG